MKLLIAPESSVAMCPNCCLSTLLGNLTNFLNCNLLLNLSLNVGGWYVLSWLTASDVKFAEGSFSFQDGSSGFLLS